MGIFKRLKQMAESEVNDIKRVLRETDGSPRAAAEAEERERQRLAAEAEAELARADDPAASEPAAGDSDLARGAAMWGTPDAAAPAPAAPAREVGGAFPREIREAYAALELPLGSDRLAVAQAVLTIEDRFRAPHFAADPKLAAIARDRTASAQAARLAIEAWLARSGA